jgi:hypothetical protein
LLVLACAGLTRLALVDGWWRTMRIAGGSMAETYLGPHWEVSCRECGMPFRCGVEHPPASDLAVCPNCGCPDNSIHLSEVHAGDRVWVDGWSHQLSGPRAWQAVAFATAADPDVLAVKRLVAPGPGRVAIRNGDVYLNEVIQRKNLEQLREVCVPVHIDAFRSPVGSRWRPSSNPSHWTINSLGYAAVAGSDGPDLDWLEYVQWTCWPNDDPRRERTQSVPIVDHDPYNQGFARGPLHEVPDLYLSCTLQLGTRSRCVIRLRSRRDCFTWEFDTRAETCRFTWNGETIGERPLQAGVAAFQAEMALCDQRLLVAVAGTPMFEYAYQPGSIPADSGSSNSAIATRDLARAAIGAGVGTVSVSNLSLARDVHYSGPLGVSDWEAPQPLTVEQWFVLGDNVSVSVDSRRWSSIEASSILGPVRHRGR